MPKKIYYWKISKIPKVPTSAHVQQLTCFAHPAVGRVKCILVGPAVLYDGAGLGGLEPAGDDVVGGWRKATRKLSRGVALCIGCIKLYIWYTERCVCTGPKHTTHTHTHTRQTFTSTSATSVTSHTHTHTHIAHSKCLLEVWHTASRAERGSNR